MTTSERLKTLATTAALYGDEKSHNLLSDAAAELEALQREVAELRDRLIKEHLPSEYGSWEKVWQNKLAIEKERDTLRAENAELREALKLCQPPQ